ncbi:sensor histidine kinase [Janthinobacterium sp. PSPC3-1]|uniref:sensor histidine kinase n=1 Tax=Janthinobacterium sp. PSPC3-1 TaxID=2804653 RepID=UPI003CF24D2C
MKSLRGRMLLVIGSCIVICWALVLAVTLGYIARGESGAWDDDLRSLGNRVLLSMPPGMSTLAAVKPALLPPAVKQSYDDDTSYQIWSNRTRQVVRAPDAPLTPLRPDFIDGFSTTLIDGKQWRVYSVADSSGTIHAQVGNLRSSIDAEIRLKVLTVLGVSTLLLLMGGALMAWAVRRALNPVIGIGAALRSREKFDLTPLPLAQLPTELHPLVVSFNHLLDQVGQAVQSERRFIDDAAHELRTPLSALQAQAQVALKAATLAEKDAALAKLLAVAQRSTRLSEQLLDLARLDAGAHLAHAALADLSELAVHVVREFDVVAEQQRRTLVIAATPCQIACDIDEIGILLRNLIDNALRFAPPGGRVRIACGHAENQVYLEVADDGPGVPEAERERIFQRFHRLAEGNNGRGSGIGLSLVAAIARLHRAGIVTGAGLDGRGFCVRILFPPS